MKNINLIKKQVAHATKTGSRSLGGATVWYISKHQNRINYYVKEVDKINGAIKWTTHRKHAMQFHTENGVHHFIHAYMKDRRDIYLIHSIEE